MGIVSTASADRCPGSVDSEVELVVVIGKHAHRIDAEHA